MARWGGIASKTLLFYSIFVEAIETKFIELRQHIVKEGLLEKNLPYYIYKSCVTFVMFAASIFIFIAVSTPWIRMLDAIFLAVAYIQAGLIAHDITHNQVFRSSKARQFFGIMFWNLFLGASAGFWDKKHSAHHANPNQIGKDTDIDQPMIFTEAQYSRAHPILKKIHRYQQYYFFPMLLLWYFTLVINSARFFISDAKERGRIPFAEVLAFLIHHALFYTTVFFFMGFWQGLLFTVIHHVISGLIPGTIFAPNHKGMPILEKELPGIFLQQIITSRNIKSNILVDFWYGGLNYQIEHHLFPTMPRKNLKKAQIFVRQFCERHHIGYHETGIIRSFAEILKGLTPIQG